MEWIDFPTFALLSAIFLVTGCVLHVFVKKYPVIRIISDFIFLCGIGSMAIFITVLWIHLNRPPLRTLGETRIWHSFFLSLVGFVAYKRWRYFLFLLFCVLMALLFLLLNYIHPENQDKILMPALQSPWFVPHVVVYILGYALLFGSAIAALIGLLKYYFGQFDNKLIHMADNLVYLGFAMLTLGLLFGALWAKTAWGSYWTWDPKETWALLTWLGYLIYIHYRFHQPQKNIFPLWMLSLAFLILLVAWFGINYLPSAQNSVHVYSGQ
jgi:ABC-type transport system involved in cytochrome c biogenesis permease subunit